MKNTYPISDVEGLMNVIPNLDSAYESPLWFGEYQDNPNLCEGFKAIVNGNTNKVEMTTRNHYNIIQNSEAVRAIGEALKEKGLEIQGRFDDFGGRIKMDCFFTSDNVPIVEDDAKGVKLGFSMENSYNGSSSFKLSMFGFRMICQNGMTVGSVMNNISEVKRHIGNTQFETLKEMAMNFFTSVINSSSALKRVIDQSINDIASWEEISKILLEKFTQKKHRDKIAEKLGITFIEIEDEKTKKKSIVPIKEKEAKDSYTRWEVYNAITNYATHDEGISRIVSGYMQENAERILKNSFKELLITVGAE